MDTAKLDLQDHRIIITFTCDEALPVPEDPDGSVVPMWENIPHWADLAERGLLHSYALTPDSAHALDVPVGYRAIDIHLTDLGDNLYAIQTSPNSEPVGWAELDGWLTITGWWGTLVDDWTADAV